MNLITAIYLFSLSSVAIGFHASLMPLSKRSTLFTSRSDVTIETTSNEVITGPKENLVEVAKKLNDDYGVFIIDSKAKDELKNAVAELEQSSDPPSVEDLLIGDWTLICTTATSTSLGKGVDTKKLPFFNEGPLKKIRDSVNRCLTVVQRIRSNDGDEQKIINRIDNVLEYQPPASLKDVLDNLPEALTSLNINPLDVIKSKVILVHEANVESGSVPLKTNLTLKSIVVNVAGTSQYLTEEGDDILGLNIPFGDFLQTGSFETTYVDESLRVSRGKNGNGIVEQVRVFIRSQGDNEYDDGDTALDEEGREEPSNNDETNG